MVQLLSFWYCRNTTSIVGVLEPHQGSCPQEEGSPCRQQTPLP
jgi:hypothetical protein